MKERRREQFDGMPEIKGRILEKIADIEIEPGADDADSDTEQQIGGQLFCRELLLLAEDEDDDDAQDKGRRDKKRRAPNGQRAGMKENGLHAKKLGIPDDDPDPWSWIGDRGRLGFINGDHGATEVHHLEIEC